jgi:hypothetical protein
MSKVAAGQVLGRRGRADGWACEQVLDFMGIEDGKGWFDGALVS